jgi:hypothetical protein
MTLDKAAICIKDFRVIKEAIKLKFYLQKTQDMPYFMDKTCQ